MSSASLRNNNFFFDARGLFFAVAVLAAVPGARAQGSDPKALRWVQMAVDVQLQSDLNDHSPWMYRDHDVRPGSDTAANVVETHRGDVRQVVERNGRPLTASEAKQERERILEQVRVSKLPAKPSRGGPSRDDEQAAEVLRMMPQAYVWTIVSETPDLVTLHYVPDPKFSAPSFAAKVMAQMTGEMVVTKQGTHLRTLKGRLMHDVRLGFGLVRLKAGGTFDVERREVGPGHWQIVEQHTHIEGHALLFKTISEQEDEVKTEFKPSPANSVEDAARLLGLEQ